MTAPCATHDRAFADHGVEHGADLVSRTYYRMAESDHAEPEPTSAFLDAVTRAFRDAYYRAADGEVVPPAVDAAVEDAADAMAHRLLDDADGDLRTDVLPTFYGLVAAFYCEAAHDH